MSSQTPNEIQTTTLTWARDFYAANIRAHLPETHSACEVYRVGADDYEVEILFMQLGGSVYGAARVTPRDGIVVSLYARGTGRVGGVTLARGPSAAEAS